MKAIALDEYGGPEVLSLRELPDPLLSPDGVLIDVRAAGVNPVDYKIREGYLRGLFPHHTPLIPGWDVAGVVAAVGPAVTAFAAGDEVYAYARKDTVQSGTYAERVVVADRAVARKPAGLSFAQAGAVPLAGLTALQSLREVGVHSGDTVLVHAAAGGVGHFAVQIARAMGAGRVIGTASGGNHDFLRSLGAQPLAYGPDLPERLAALVGGDGKVDAAVDYVGGEALAQSRVVVRDPARHGSIVDAQAVLEQGGRYTFVRPDGDGLAYLATLVAEGTLRVEVAREFPLAEAADAQRLVAGGHVRGKVVLTV
jgi:NADPH:quinone reductase-like Zn-dependent oxidoreductase